MGNLKGPFRADHVGSLQRPRSLLNTRELYKAGTLSREELRIRENEAIERVVRLQEDVGLQGITDGEYRRENFHFDFFSQIGGVDFRRRMPEGSEGHSIDPEKAPFVAYITDKLSRPAEGVEIENFKLVQGLTDRTPKITIPSPTMTHFRGGRDAIDRDTYPEIEEFFSDLARIYREELTDLASAGCRYVQFDDTNLAYLCDENMRDGVRKLGEDPDKLPTIYSELINKSIPARPNNMAVCVHMCRGNAQSQWFASGGYETIAETVFNLTKVDGFFLEYDDDRAGGFEPLRFVPKGGPKIVLGLLTTKRGEMESRTEILGRIEEASKYVDLEQLCLSPQCGFSSNAIGNSISVKDQVAKLRAIVDIAEEVWG
ncbi:MAG: 5-methyltetrahydropteroyltriglutamate--homocysteine S-methyltransferase [Pseudomonadota bacterium]|nr:5-methyltetrahydropteroyltriglutamate--homocysteine S-methyltransferase [Pseudomonadota bacterium]